MEITNATTVEVAFPGSKIISEINSYSVIAPTRKTQKAIDMLENSVNIVKSTNATKHERFASMVVNVTFCFLNKVIRAIVFPDTKARIVSSRRAASQHAIYNAKTMDTVSWAWVKM